MDRVRRMNWLLEANHQTISPNRNLIKPNCRTLRKMWLKEMNAERASHTYNHFSSFLVGLPILFLILFSCFINRYTSRCFLPFLRENGLYYTSFTTNRSFLIWKSLLFASLSDIHNSRNDTDCTHMTSISILSTGTNWTWTWFMDLADRGIPKKVYIALKRI